MSHTLCQTAFLCHRQAWLTWKVSVVGVLICRAGIYEGHWWRILAWKCHMYVYDNTILVPFQSKLPPPNLWWFCNCVVRCCEDGAYFFPRNLLQSHPWPVWMQFALFCVAKVLGFIWLGSNQKGPGVVAKNGFLKGLPVLVRTFLSIFPSTSSRPLPSILGQIFW